MRYKSHPILLQLVAQKSLPLIESNLTYYRKFLFIFGAPTLLRHLVGEEESRVKRKRRFVTPIAHGFARKQWGRRIRMG